MTNGNIFNTLNLETEYLNWPFFGGKSVTDKHTNSNFIDIDSVDRWLRMTFLEIKPIEYISIRGKIEIYEKWQMDIASNHHQAI